jgi:hypothetical protein
VKEFPEPSPEERARRYRELAEFALEKASVTQTGHVRHSYLALAQQWTGLAEHAEKLDSQTDARVDHVGFPERALRPQR